MTTHHQVTAVVIGCGRMGQSHIQALDALGIQVKWLCDVREECLHQAESLLSYDVACTTEISTVLSQSQPVDLAIVATTADHHCEIVCELAQIGVKSILCEKPLACSVADAELIQSTCERFGTVCAVNHQMRFMEQYITVKELIYSSSNHQQLISMHVVAGCFGLAMNGSHYIEAFRYLTGEIPEKVTAWLDDEQIKSPRGERFFEWSGKILIEYSNGKHLMINAGKQQHHGMTAVYSTQNGVIFVNELEGKIVESVRQTEYLDAPSTRYGMPADSRVLEYTPSGNVDSSEKTINALLKGEDYPDVSIGVTVVEVLAAAYHSHHHGHCQVDLHSAEFDKSKLFHWA